MMGCEGFFIMGLRLSVGVLSIAREKFQEGFFKRIF